MLSAITKNLFIAYRALNLPSTSIVYFNPIIVPQCFNHGWANWRMAKDVRKRRALEEHSVNKLRVNALRKNSILPKEIKEIADKEIQKFPGDALGIKIKPRCAFTSRPRGNVLRWRVSRIVFRDLADHNRLAGIQRAIW